MTRMCLSAEKQEQNRRHLGTVPSLYATFPSYLLSSGMAQELHILLSFNSLATL